MSKEWLSLLLGTISVLCTNPEGALAGPTEMNPADRTGGSIQGPGTVTHQPIAPRNSTEKTTPGGSTTMAPTSPSEHGSLVPNLGNLLQGSLSLFSGILSAPLNLVFALLERVSSLVRSFLSRLSETLGDLSIAVSERGWRLTKNFIFPMMDRVSSRAENSDLVPSNVKDILRTLSSSYHLFKYLGYLKPEN